MTVDSSGRTTVTAFHQLLMTARVPFSLHEYNPTILQAAPLLACAVFLYSFCVCFAADSSLPSHQRWQRGAKGEAALLCLLGVNVVVIILPKVGACSAASCFLLWCAVLIFPFTSWWKGTQGCYKSLWRSHAITEFPLFLILVIAVIFWPYFRHPHLQVSFHPCHKFALKTVNGYSQAGEVIDLHVE